jgi:hypothetical protein
MTEGKAGGTSEGLIDVLVVDDYLKLLERSSRVRLTLKYGETGRPEHRYLWGFSSPPAN